MMEGKYCLLWMFADFVHRLADLMFISIHV